MSSARWLFALLLLAAPPTNALAQEESRASNAAPTSSLRGTVVVYRVTAANVVIAPDSRAIIGKRHRVQILNNVCKIKTFDHKYVFTSTGHAVGFDCASNAKLWDVRDIAAQVYRSGVSNADDFMQKWTERMQPLLEGAAKKCRVLTGPGGFVATALFVGGSDRELTARAVTVGFQGGGKGIFKATAQPIEVAGQPHAIGHFDVVKEFQGNQTPRAKHWHKRIDGLQPDAQIAALAQLAKKLDDTGEVGGPIDAIRITSGKPADWLSVKPDCEQP